MPRINENFKIIIITLSAIAALCIILLVAILFKTYFSFLTLKTLKTDLIFTRGIVYECFGNYNLANKDFIYTLEKGLHKSMAYLGVGDIELRAGHYKEAIDGYNNALLLKPEYTYAYLNRAKAKKALGDDEGAISDYNEFHSRISHTNIKKNTTQTDKFGFGPYMINLQKEIKSNWSPPKMNNSKITVASFSIDKDGGLKNVKIKNSSGIKSTDEAAILAIKTSAPFEPLPKAYKEKHVNIDFTFDYNVLKHK